MGYLNSGICLRNAQHHWPEHGHMSMARVTVSVCRPRHNHALTTCRVHTTSWPDHGCLNPLNQQRERWATWIVEFACEMLPIIECALSPVATATGTGTCGRSYGLCRPQHSTTCLRPAVLNMIVWCLVHNIDIVSLSHACVSNFIKQQDNDQMMKLWSKIFITCFLTMVRHELLCTLNLILLCNIFIVNGYRFSRA